MIETLSGQVAEVGDGFVVLDREGIGFRVAIPAYCLGELASRNGQGVMLHTLLFIDGQQNGQMEPHLVGFTNSADKVFFRRFISVKGIGWKKALKALAFPAGQVASWIEHGDATSLKQLPGIGSRAADLIIAQLKGKMDDLALAAGATRGNAMVGATGHVFSEGQRDALEIMVALGDSRVDAEGWVLTVMERESGESPTSAEDWIRAAYAIRSGVV